MHAQSFDLSAAAYTEMLREGFHPDFPPETPQQLASIRAAVAVMPAPSSNLRDLRSLLWSSIDNDTSRDLDQIEVAERIQNGIRVRVAIADVSAAVAKDTPLDQHAKSETETVYTATRNFPMLPLELSTGLTSFNENEDRTSMVIEYVVAADGTLQQPTIYRALVRNRAQLTYGAVGSWLEGKAAPDSKVAVSAALQMQLKLQDEAAQALRAQRARLGALEFNRVEATPIVINGQVQTLKASERNRATELIENFMIATNEIMARSLIGAKRSSIRRIVKSPERWSRIVDLARQRGASLPAQPDSAALNAFLQAQRAADPLHYPDLSLAIIKLMGPGEYVLAPGNSTAQQGHFGLAALDYTHSTAPNRRFADLVTQRLVKAMLADVPAPYTDAELDLVAQHCTERESAGRKVERAMQKRVAAVALAGSIGQTFHGVITGVNDKGTFVRIINPPVEGKIVQGGQGLDVGDTVTVKLIHTDPQHAFIDFADVRSSNNSGTST